MPRISNSPVRWLLFTVIAVLVFASLLPWIGPTSRALQNRLDVHSVEAQTLPPTAVVTVTRSAAFSPIAVAVGVGGVVRFQNREATHVDIETAGDSADGFHVDLSPGSDGAVRLTRVGLYHYYDSRVAHAGEVEAGSQVITNRDPGGATFQGWIIVLAHAPGIQEYLNVPPGNDLFSPKALAAVVGSTIMVSNHDADAHNLVVDPASPSGGAFIVRGTDAELPDGWHRALTVTRPGLYHIYCTFHTVQVGMKGQWQLLAPIPAASGYRAHNPMETWIVVLPANVAG
jgi:plastocyanin